MSDEYKVGASWHRSAESKRPNLDPRPWLRHEWPSSSNGVGQSGRRCAQAMLTDEVAKADVVITTALIPGRKAPVLIPEAMVAGMKRGSVIVDMASVNGGMSSGPSTVRKWSRKMACRSSGILKGLQTTDGGIPALRPQPGQLFAERGPADDGQQGRVRHRLRGPGRPRHVGGGWRQADVARRRPSTSRRRPRSKRPSK